MKIYANIDCKNTCKIVNHPSPVNSSDLANKIYVDSLETKLNNYIAKLENTITSLQGQVTQLQGQLAQVQGQVTQLQGQVTQVQIQESQEFDLNEQELKALIIARLEQYNLEQQANYKDFVDINNFLGSWQSKVYASTSRSMLGTLSDQDGNFMVAGKGIVTLFLALVNPSISLKTLIAKKDWKNIDIAEWVFISTKTDPKAASYLKAFGSLGLKENGMLVWISNAGKIGGYLIINKDGSVFMSKAP